MSHPLQDTLAISKAIGDETRLRTLAALELGELCLCQLVEFFALAPSTVSKHANILHAAGLIERRKQGRWVFYRLATRSASPAVRRALRWLRDTLSEDPTIAADRVRLDDLLKRDLQELTVCYSGS